MVQNRKIYLIRLSTFLTKGRFVTQLSNVKDIVVSDSYVKSFLLVTIFSLLTWERLRDKGIKGKITWHAWKPNDRQHRRVSGNHNRKGLDFFSGNAKVNLFPCFITGNQTEDFQRQKDKLLWKKILRSPQDESPLGQRLIQCPDLHRLHTTVIITAWYLPAQSQVRPLRSAVFLAGSSPRPRQHLLIIANWHLPRPVRRKPVGRPRRPGFGKWSWSVGTTWGSRKMNITTTFCQCFVRILLRFSSLGFKCRLLKVCEIFETFQFWSERDIIEWVWVSVKTTKKLQTSKQQHDLMKKLGTYSWPLGGSKRGVFVAPWPRSNFS